MTTPTPGHPNPGSHQTGAPSDLPDPRNLSVAQLEAEIRALMARADQAALADPLSLAVHLDDRVVRRPHLEVISSTIARLTPGGGDRVIIICPPQVGKTWTACWSILWWLIKHPDHRVIIGSYGTTLAADRGRTIRRLVEQFGARYGLELMKGAKSVTNWSLTSGGGCRSAGVGAGITGMPADCVAEGTRILTPMGYLPVEQVANMPSPLVLSYDHDRQRTEWRPVQAARRIANREVIELVTESGRRLRCTPDHLIYTVDHGYIRADSLQPGTRLLAHRCVPSLQETLPAQAESNHEVPQTLLFQGLPRRGSTRRRDTTTVRALHAADALAAQPPANPLLLEVRRSGQSGTRDTDLRPLPPAVPAHERGGSQSSTQRLDENLLFQKVPARQHHTTGTSRRAPVQEMRKPSHRQVRREIQDVLLYPVPQNLLRRFRPLPAMRRHRRAASLRTGQGRPQRTHWTVLLQAVHGRLPRRVQGTTLRNLRRNDRAGTRQTVLLRHLQNHRNPGPQTTTDLSGQQRLSTVWRHFPAENLTAYLLSAFVRQHRPRASHGRTRQLTLQGRQELRLVVPGNAALDPRKGPARLRRMRQSGQADRLHTPRQDPATQFTGDPSPERGPVGQPPHQPRDVVPRLPQDPPRVDHDTVSLVGPVHRESVAVYDLQVEGNSNFFADEVLVHNCFLIDDPIRSRADAESRLIREQIWDWWSGDVNSRLAPGAPVVLVQTRWHVDDLAGRLMAEEGTVAEGGRWQVIYLPAFAVPADADRGIPPDSLGRSPGQPLPHPRIAPEDKARLVAHWEDKRRSATARDWAALWQGDPRPVEGALVTRSLLRERHCYNPTATPIKHAIAIDPAGEGRDSVGLVAGWLGDDQRLYVSQDASMSGGVTVEKWTHQAVMLAYTTDADVIVYEQNYGKGLVRRVITAAWEDAQREGHIPATRPMPLLVPEKAKKGKYLRAEPVAQLLTVDKIRLAAPMPELESEWTTWVPTDPMSPGRLDAMVYLAYRLLRPRRSRAARGQGINPGSVSRLTVINGAAGHQVSRTAVAARNQNRDALALRRRLG